MGDGKKGSGDHAQKLCRAKGEHMIIELRQYFANAQGKRAQNVLHFQSQTVPTVGDPYQAATALASAYATSVQAALLACIGNDTVLSAYSAKVADGAGGPTFSTAVGVAGSATAPSLSMLVAANIALLPGAPPYKRKEGHIYVPAMPDTFCDGDQLSSAGFTAYSAYAAAVNTPISAAGTLWDLVIYDRATQVGTAISDSVVKANVSGHRRRLRPVVA